VLRLGLEPREVMLDFSPKVHEEPEENDDLKQDEFDLSESVAYEKNWIGMSRHNNPFPAQGIIKKQVVEVTFAPAGGAT
jgi:hypothetical protein